MQTQIFFLNKFKKKGPLLFMFFSCLRAFGLRLNCHQKFTRAMKSAKPLVSFPSAAC